MYTHNFLKILIYQYHIWVIQLTIKCQYYITTMTTLKISYIILLLRSNSMSLANILYTVTHWQDCKKWDRVYFCLYYYISLILSINKLKGVKFYNCNTSGYSKYTKYTIDISTYSLEFSNKLEEARSSIT